MKLSRILLGSLMAAMPLGLFAQEAVVEDKGAPPKAVSLVEPSPEPTIVLSPVIVTARGVPQLVSQTPGGVSVMEEREFQELQPLSLSDATSRLPGVNVSHDGRWGGEVNIRGLDRGRLVFLLDGQRIITATDVAAQFGLVLPMEVERVEVLKGPISQLYGSGSIGGVVNVITKGADFTDSPEFHGGTTFSGTTNGDGYGVHAWTSYSQEDFWAYLSGGMRSGNSYKDGAHDEVKNSFFDDAQSTLKLGYKWNDWNVTEFKYSRYRAKDVGLPGASNLPAISQRVVYPRTTLEDFALKHTLAPDGDVWKKSTFELGFGIIERHVRIDRFNKVASGPQQVLVAPNATHRTLSARQENHIELADGHNLTIGADYWRWSYTGSRLKKIIHPRLGPLSAWDDPLSDSVQNNAGVYAEYDWAIAEDWTLNLGLRTDYNWSKSAKLYATNIANGKKTLVRKRLTSSDWAWSGHVGLTWDFADEWSMTLIGARGYRTADLMDRYKYIQLNATAGTATWGDPSLDPEVSWYVEYGLHYEGEKARANLALFYNQLHDLIEAKAYGNPVTIGGVKYYNERMSNVARAVIKGVEFDGEYRLTNELTAYGAVAWMEGENESEHTYLRYNPPVNGLVGLRSKWNNGLWIAVEAEAAGGQRHTPKGVQSSRRWATMNLRAGYEFKLWEMDSAVTFTAANLFNTCYTNYLSTTRNLAYQEPGRNFSLAFSTKF